MLPVLTDMLTDAGNRSDVRRFLILTILCRNVTLVWKLLLFKKEKNMANMNDNADVFCTSCGAKMPAGTKFCVACGKPIVAPAAANQQNVNANQTAYTAQSMTMPKTNLGVTVGLMAAAIYLLAIAGGYIPLLLIGGYVVLVEKDAWLKRVVIKALALMLLFSVMLTVIGLIPDVLSWISGLASVFDGVFTYGKASAVVGVISGLIDIVRTVLFLVLGLNALKMKDVSIGWIDNMINRNR